MHLEGTQRKDCVQQCGAVELFWRAHLGGFGALFLVDEGPGAAGRGEELVHTGVTRPDTERTKLQSK